MNGKLSPCIFLDFFFFFLTKGKQSIIVVVSAVLMVSVRSSDNASISFLGTVAAISMFLDNVSEPVFCCQKAIVLTCNLKPLRSRWNT